MAGLERAVELPSFPQPGITGLLAFLTAVGLALFGLGGLWLIEDEYSGPRTGGC